MITPLAELFTHACRKYTDEIKTMMVAPLNAWDGKRQSMIGLLYVTSREKNIFSIKYVDSMRFVADIVAKAFAFFVRQRKLLDNSLMNRGG